jgi:ring-1,2-phenylacetyl-CoA epoxidase subunit PaaD
MVATLERERLRRRALDVAATVVDPEIPVLTIADLGVLRDARVAEDGAIEVDITPTYSGCPAMRMIALQVEMALRGAGFSAFRVNEVLAPAWTTDWMSEAGRAKLRDYGIAPPPRATRRALFGDETAPSCPRCASTATEKLSEFGSTACKSLWRCTACREPFDAFKCL